VPLAESESSSYLKYMSIVPSIVLDKRSGSEILVVKSMVLLKYFMSKNSNFRVNSVAAMTANLVSGF
jgi:hypothetical protein